MSAKEDAMEISDVRVYPQEGRKNLRGFASLTLDGSFAVRDLKIVEGERGLFVAMPARKDSRGRYHDVAYPVTKEFYAAVQSRVLGAYREAAKGRDARQGNGRTPGRGG
jgi:stage V sporulation protein G